MTAPGLTVRQVLQSLRARWENERELGDDANRRYSDEHMAQLRAQAAGRIRQPTAIALEQLKLERQAASELRSQVERELVPDAPPPGIAAQLPWLLSQPAQFAADTLVSAKATTDTETLTLLAYLPRLHPQLGSIAREAREALVATDARYAEATDRLTHASHTRDGLLQLERDLHTAQSAILPPDERAAAESAFTLREVLLRAGRDPQ